MQYSRNQAKYSIALLRKYIFIIVNTSDLTRAHLLCDFIFADLFYYY